MRALDCAVPQNVELRKCVPLPRSCHPDEDRDVYLVLNDFGRLGAAWCEAGENDTHREVASVTLACQYNSPVRVIAFNTEQGTSRDVSAEIAAELVERCADDRPEGPPECLHDFIDRYGVPRRPIQLRLPIAV